MSNKKQQTAVEWLFEQLQALELKKNRISKDAYESRMSYTIGKAKEIQKDQHIKTWEAGLMKVDFNEYYEQTYGGNK